jgi:hypothetical protein
MRKPKEHQSSPHYPVLLPCARNKSSTAIRQCPLFLGRMPRPSHTTRHSRPQMVRPTHYPACRSADIHAPATNYGGGMNVVGLKDVSVHPSVSRPALPPASEPAVSAGGKGLLARETWSFPLAQRPATGNNH